MGLANTMDDIKIKNHANFHYYPTEKLSEGLHEVIIFPENERRNDFPNGSVWKYNITTSYNPEILKEDVGCGMTAYIIEKQDYNQDFINSIGEIILKNNISIGRGNHFINFTEGHPYEKDMDMIVLHSNMNNKQYRPLTFEEAFDMETNAKEKRKETVELLLEKLNIGGYLLDDWTHNAVEVDEEVIYRKGVIDISKSDGQGLLALNPISGFYFYVSENDYFQHGVGRNNSKGPFDMDQFQVFNKGKVLIYDMRKENPNLKGIEEYNSFRIFLDKFHQEILSSGFSDNKLVIKTN